jgi:DNA-binding PadR family transcriptional regulator
MSDHKTVEQYLPLTEAAYYTLLALVEPMHGYRIIQRTRGTSRGTVEIGPGTMYGVFSSLENQGLIVKVKEEERRKVYALTTLGRSVLREQIERLKIMTQNGLAVLDQLG